ncbi:MAG: flippase, partial [Bacillota bacterium]|nr:flippase [Bacillota bacterium]
MVFNMIAALRRKTQSEDAKRLIKNFISLSVVQGLNYILPLITIPYITRVLGAENFGLVGIAAAFMTYFSIFTDYGFNLSATKEISINRDHKEKVSEIFSSVMLVKSVLCIIGFFIMLVIILNVGMFKADFLVYLVSYGTVIGNVLFPIWFFQGIERMKYITYLNIFSRGIVTILIFILVKNKGDLIIYVTLNSLSAVAIGMVSLILVLWKFGIRIHIPSLKNIKSQMIEGWYVFISSISIVLYTSSTTLLLGLFTGKAMAGYYAGADKIRVAVQGLVTPVFQTVYPHVNKLAQESWQKALGFIKKELIIFGVAGFIVSLMIIVKSDFIVRMFLGKGYDQSVPVLRILAFTPLMVLFGNIVTVQCLLSLGLKKEYSRIYIAT